MNRLFVESQIRLILIFLSLLIIDYGNNSTSGSEILYSQVLALLFFFLFFCSITNCFKMDVAVNIELFFNFTDSRVLEVTILSPELANE